jgi:hypothetical protein
MKYCFVFFLFLTQKAFTQKPGCENIFIITTDGYRWQELFNGADSALLFNTAYVDDTATLKDIFWSGSTDERRKRLMPFTWNYIEKNGQIWGNRKYQNEVAVSNPYRFSYAGYNEILTGYADPGIVANKPRKNPNQNVLSYLNTLPAFENRVAAFGSWNLFPYIINGESDPVSLNAGYQLAKGDSLSDTEKAVNTIQEYSSYNSLPTRSDLLTFTLATEYISKKHPRVVFIGFGETDEFAHHGEYDNYLAQANLFDKFLAELWMLIQRDPFYRNKTTLLVTTDHGRGRKPAKWKKHGPITGGSQETWMMQLGPNVPALGEMKHKAAVSNIQFAQTIASYLGETFIADHPISPPVSYNSKN